MSEMDIAALTHAVLANEDPACGISLKAKHKVCRPVKTALHQAVLDGRTKQVRILVERLGTKVNALDVYGRTPLILACMLDTRNAYRIIDILLNRGADVNIGDGLGRTALHYACIKGCDEIACVLLNQASIDIHIKDIFDYTTLMYAALAANPETVRILTKRYLTYGLTVDDDKDSRGFTPLLLACKCGHFASALILLQRGKANPQIRDRDILWNALEWALSAPPIVYTLNAGDIGDSTCDTCPGSRLSEIGNTTLSIDESAKDGASETGSAATSNVSKDPAASTTSKDHAEVSPTSTVDTARESIGAHSGHTEGSHETSHRSTVLPPVTTTTASSNLKTRQNMANPTMCRPSGPQKKVNFHMRGLDVSTCGAAARTPGSNQPSCCYQSEQRYRTSPGRTPFSREMTMYNMSTVHEFKCHHHLGVHHHGNISIRPGETCQPTIGLPSILKRIHTPGRRLEALYHGEDARNLLLNKLDDVINDRPKYGFKTTSKSQRLDSSSEAIGAPCLQPPTPCNLKRPTSAQVIAAGAFPKGMTTCDLVALFQLYSDRFLDGGTKYLMATVTRLRVPDPMLPFGTTANVCRAKPHDGLTSESALRGSVSLKSGVRPPSHSTK